MRTISTLDITPGDTIRVVGLHEVGSDRYGATHSLSVGTIRKSSPTFTVAAVEPPAYHSRGLRTRVIVLTDGTRIVTSTRQRVHLLDDEEVNQ